MLCRFLLFLALAVAAAAPASAQSIQIVQDCAAGSSGLGLGGRLFVDQTGKLCVAIPIAPSGKIVPTSVALTANTSTQLVAANPNRVAIEIQCDGTAAVGISRTGATLTSVAASPLVIPSGSYPLYTMPLASPTAITAYTGTAQTCRVTEYVR